LKINTGFKTRPRKNEKKKLSEGNCFPEKQRGRRKHLCSEKKGFGEIKWVNQN